MNRTGQEPASGRVPFGEFSRVVRDFTRYSARVLTNIVDNLEEANVRNKQQKPCREFSQLILHSSTGIGQQRYSDDVCGPRHQISEHWIRTRERVRIDRLRNPQCGVALQVWGNVPQLSFGLFPVPSERAGTAKELGRIGDPKNRLETQTEAPDASCAPLG